MAVYHFSVKNIARSDGRSSVAAAAYRSGELLVDHRTGLAYDYTHKRVHHAELLLPDRVPDWACDRSKLWNAVEAAENRRNSRTSREFEIALPRELTHDQKIALAREFAQLQLVSRGMCADLGFHEFDGKNPHVHILTTTRNIGENGFQDKNRDWNRRELVETWRVAWANVANRHLAAAGYDARIDHRNLVDQGIDRPAQIKEYSRPSQDVKLHNEKCREIAQAQAALADEREQQELAAIVREAVEQNQSHLLMRSAKTQVKRAREQLASCTDAKPAADLAAERAKFDAMQAADKLLRRARSVLQLARQVPAMLRELKNNFTMESNNGHGWLRKNLAERNRHLTRQQRNSVEPKIRQRESDLWSEPEFKMQ